MTGAILSLLCLRSDPSLGVLSPQSELMTLAEEALADAELPEKEGFMRKIVKEPVGVVFVIVRSIQ